MATDRRADVVWQGSLREGSGTIVSTTSGVIGEQPVTWVNRSEDSPTATSPEELIAAAHASCFSMSLSGALSRAETPPTELRTSATVTFQPDPEPVVSSTAKLLICAVVVCAWPFSATLGSEPVSGATSKAR